MHDLLQTQSAQQNQECGDSAASKQKKGLENMYICHQLEQMTPRDCDNAALNNLPTV